MELISQGAEAKLFRDRDKVIKERFSKEYRLAHLDESLRKFRTRREAKVLRRLGEIDFPAPKFHDFCDKRMTITMDFIHGDTVKSYLEKQENQDDYQILAKDIGKNIAMLHHKNIVHGDLTTSNMMKNVEDQKIKMIDFGLSSFTDKVEDKAVDLFLLDRALESKHYQIYPGLFDQIISNYKSEYPEEAEKVLKRLEEVKKRGRHKK